MARNFKRLPKGYYRDIGHNIRLTRTAAGKSQTEIADHLGITFQQVQKYENGTNRIPIDRIVKLAAYFDVPIGHFFPTTDTSEGDSALRSPVEDLSNKELRELHKTWKAIKDPRIRAATLKYLKSVAALSR
jgi:transcriptional regulator with XRE-family HTH domain